MASTFDTLKLSKRLEEAGLTQKQAEIISEVLVEGFLEENKKTDSFNAEQRLEMQLSLRMDKLESKIENLDKRLSQYFGLLMGSIVLLGIILKIHL
ncbi:DUF1640 domain-containing protein [Candidatus Methylacidiphilum fumarolicum]|uniref:DUF1640 domain-containing protein n=2 Tax=Candidatus Methylacidiphilum fumarolicum TaxID=591154 RepID=I0JYA1_METFB|nr:hypothetical protein [Candidatus Methylacidiphilum fumarolicum]MBW6415214.1 CCDC90 family protein [Candidatus Methylacidiphilum fumarolicum]TFE69821.1 DUF1640 domain-containing protein [Candidatus Methylacidiphilum fumarolicum]TFE71687.1 DUF1640 domain-containing protein [Candidatus Methylacidiphilum fumarolicum]TFE72607.1 DUF1640 domain-containing protein [Candidatus Methylacidiphilum fumarolicum]TFE76699.1 hypothetical protein A7D33_08670 [Candidatus Methylacidiphilum fumarolicum]